MWYILIGIIVVIVAVILFFYLGISQLRKNYRIASQKVLEVKLDDIDKLKEECLSTFESKLGTKLDVDDFEGSSKIISDMLDNSEALIKAFHKDEFAWYFVLPVGAFTGELFRLHVNAVWKESEEGGMLMEIPVQDGGVTIFPFDKIIKQITSGDKGDMHAYFKNSKEISKMIDKLKQQVPENTAQ